MTAVAAAAAGGTMSRPLRKEGRPESTGPATSVYGTNSSRYHVTAAATQSEMAALAVQLLGLARCGHAWVLADLGCGSGLSTAAVAGTAGPAWVGFDITPAMLAIADQSGWAGHLVLADLGDGLPLRPCCLDGAVSISAVQASGCGPGCSLAVSSRRFCPVPAAPAVAVQRPNCAAQAAALFHKPAACLKALRLCCSAVLPRGCVAFPGPVAAAGAPNLLTLLPPCR